MQSVPWQREDTEAVPCCVCHREGRPIYDLDPFGVVRCPRCTMVFVSPRLNPEALQRMYDDVSYFEGDGSVYGDEGASRRRCSCNGSGWPAGSPSPRGNSAGRWPDRGCSRSAARTGCSSTRRSRRGYDVTGVELSSGAADRARDRGLTVFSSQLADAPLEGPYDVVCAWDTIEHVPDPVEFWQAVRGLVADDGVVLFSTPYFSSLPARLLRKRWWTLKPTEHIWHFTPQTHRTVAALAGMAVTRTVLNPLARANFARLDSLVGVARPIR